MPASVTHVTVGTSPFTDLGRDTGEIAVLNSSDTATVYVKLGAAGTVKGANCYRILLVAVARSKSLLTATRSCITSQRRRPRTSKIEAG